MARPRRDEIASKAMHKAFTAALRRRSASLRAASYKDVERWAYGEHRAIVSTETIRKAHLGEIDPNACGIELLLVLRDFYELGPDDLGPVAKARITAIERLVSAGPAPTDEGFGTSGWLSPTSKRHLFAVGE